MRTGLESGHERELEIGTPVAAEGFDVGRAPGRVRPRRSYAGLVQGLRERGIPDAALEQILYQNARDLYGIRA